MKRSIKKIFLVSGLCALSTASLAQPSICTYTIYGPGGTPIVTRDGPVRPSMDAARLAAREACEKEVQSSGITTNSCYLPAAQGPVNMCYPHYDF